MGKKYSKKYIIDVYQYMEFCGLICKRKEGVKLSHLAVEKKILLRKKKFPYSISEPIHESFKNIHEDDVLRGKILLVCDDYDKVQPYRRPYIRVDIATNSEYEKELIRNKLIEEELAKNSDNTLKSGAVKYEQRREKKKEKRL